MNCPGRHQHGPGGAFPRNAGYDQLQHSEDIVSLNIGGRRFITTAATLLSVKDSFLWKLMTAHQQLVATPRGLPFEGFFIDRNGKVSWFRSKLFRLVNWVDNCVACWC